MTYTAPDVPDAAHPDLLVVRDTASTGARGYSDVDRLDIATIRFGGLHIDAVWTCLEPGETLRLGATVAGDDNPDINWSVTAGTIDSDGFFTAPAEAQVVEITAEYAANPNLKDSIEFQVGGCSCQVTMNVGGQDSGMISGNFILTDDLSGVKQISSSSELGPNQSGMTLLWFDVALGTIPVDATGTYDVEAAAGQHLGSAWNNPDIINDDIENRLVVSITENDGGNVLSGSVSGVVAVSPGPELRSFSATFHIEADPVFSTATNRVCYVE